MGALMRKSTRKDLINKLLDAMFFNIKHSCPMEREVLTRHLVTYCRLVLFLMFIWLSSWYCAMECTSWGSYNL